MSRPRRAELAGRLEAWLAANARDPARPTLDELAQVDEFHVRGREATAELADLLAPEPGSLVLDAGSGLGGPARHLAAGRGCRVLGVDLDPAYAALAHDLTTRTGLADLTRFAVADVTALPLADGSADHAWSIHVGMSVPDKARLYRELRRALRPGGRLALYDLVAGDGGPPLFPAPWAATAVESHVATLPDLRGLLAGAGFRVLVAEGRPGPALAWARRLAERLERTGSAPPLLAVLHGPAEGAPVARNLALGLTGDRVRPAVVLAEAA
jgi:SAM-dependent methyltransferase